MNKTIFIGSQIEYDNKRADVFCKIEYEDKKLSISGVVGPRRNGDAIGSCGQILDAITVDKFADGWDEAKLAQFLTIWKEHHLNNMSPCTPEMKTAGWGKLAQTPIYKYSYILTCEASDRKKALEKQITQNAIDHVQQYLTAEEKRLLKTRYGVDLYGYELPDSPEFMSPSLDHHNKKHKIEKETLGWVSQDEHPDGLLGKKLNGQGYGSAWCFHEVPDEAIAFLEALPDAAKTPAWV